jgi:hypothetical protein
MGGLMQHIEKTCKVISNMTLIQARTEKLEFSEGLGQLGDMAITHTQNAHPVYFAPEPGKLEQDFPKIPSQAFRDGDAKGPDLITGDDANASDLGKWSAEKKLFPNAPLPVRPAPGQLGTANQAARKAEYLEQAKYDPDHPSFNIMRTYNQFTEKFNCPHALCR